MQGWFSRTIFDRIKVSATVGTSPPTGFMFEKQHMHGLYFNQSPSECRCNAGCCSSYGFHETGPSWSSGGGIVPIGQIWNRPSFGRTFKKSCLGITDLNVVVSSC